MHTQTEVFPRAAAHTENAWVPRGARTLRDVKEAGQARSTKGRTQFRQTGGAALQGADLCSQILGYITFREKLVEMLSVHNAYFSFCFFSLAFPRLNLILLFVLLVICYASPCSLPYIIILFNCTSLNHT